MRLLPDATANTTKYQEYLRLSQRASNVLIIDLDDLRKLSYISCEMIVAIDHLHTMSIAGLIMVKDSPLLAAFAYGYGKRM